MQSSFEIDLCKRIFSWPFSFVVIVLQFDNAIKHFGGGIEIFFVAGQIDGRNHHQMGGATHLSG
ncbi:MAG: hypothetical protein J6Q55_01410 [Clostridia bacterium]|nr:hypothetical protein [Clostridia bacterium]